MLLPLSIRIPLGITIAVVVTGIIAFIKIGTRGTGTFPTVYFVIWLVVSAVLVGITIWSWRRNRRN